MRGKRHLAVYCKACARDYKNEWYARSPEGRRKQRQRSVESRQRIVEEINRLKAETPCADCGYHWNPWQMQFDHIKGEKVGNVGTMIRRTSHKVLFEEIVKCEMVCANCHADRTHERRQNA